MKSTQLERSKFSNSSVSYEKSKYNLDVYSKKKTIFHVFHELEKIQLEQHSRNWNFESIDEFIKVIL